MAIALKLTNSGQDTEDLKKYSYTYSGGSSGTGSYYPAMTKGEYDKARAFVDAIGIEPGDQMILKNWPLAEARFVGLSDYQDNNTYPSYAADHRDLPMHQRIVFIRVTRSVDGRPSITCGNCIAEVDWAATSLRKRLNSGAGNVIQLPFNPGAC